MNPVITQIDLNGATGNASGHITCTTNAGFTQQATVTVTDANSKVVASGIFQGKGEHNQVIPVTTGGTVLSFSNAVLPLKLEVECKYDPNGSFVPNAPDKVIMTKPLDTKSVEFVQITSEDWVDDDFNDLIFNCVSVSH